MGIIITLRIVISMFTHLIYRATRHRLDLARFDPVVPLWIECFAQGIEVRSACVGVCLATLGMMWRIDSREYICTGIRLQALRGCDYVERFWESC